MKYILLLLLAAAVVAFRPVVVGFRPATVGFRPAADNRTYVSFKGSRQGLVKGGSGREQEGWFEINSFSWQVRSPTDVTSTPAPSAKRRYDPIIIKKQVDAASPFLLEALNTQEKMEVVVQVLDPDKKVIRTITMKNALVKGIHKDDWENVTIYFTEMIDK